MNLKEVTLAILKDFQNDQPLGKYSEFKATYPKLFAMVTNPSCDTDLLNKCINIFDQHAKRLIDKKEGDELFGSAAAKKDVYPLVGSPSSEDMDYATKRIQKE
jgi:hypothetical protein